MSKGRSCGCCLQQPASLRQSPHFALRNGAGVAETVHMEKRILVVDDDRLIRQLVRDALEGEGFRVGEAASGPEAIERMRAEGPPAIVLSDLSMREMDGLALLEHIKTDYPKTDVIILAGYASLESALQAMRLGAADYLRKPVRDSEVIYAVKRTALRRRLLDENSSLRTRLQAFEATRVLTNCIEPTDVIPLALDIILRMTNRGRAVGTIVPGTAVGVLDPTCLVGFDDAAAARLRDHIERGKLFQPSTLEIESGSETAGLQERLVELGIDPGSDDMLARSLRTNGTLAGGIWVLADGRPFDEGEIHSAELVLAQAELALINAQRFLKAREKAFVDDVTDLYNVRYLLSALDREVNRAGRANLKLSVLFLDLDRFKSVNDSHGHLVGSRVLKDFGGLLQDSIRAIDTVGRYGGDEFTILLVDTDHEGAMNVAERIRAMVEETRFGADRGLALELTVSIGVSTFPQHGDTHEALIDFADKAMYLGKAQGRNLVCSADELISATSPGLSNVPRG